MNVVLFGLLAFGLGAWFMYSYLKPERREPSNTDIYLDKELKRLGIRKEGNGPTKRPKIP